MASLPKAVFCKNCRGKVLKHCAAGSVVKLYRRKEEEKLPTSRVKINRKEGEKSMKRLKHERKTQSMKRLQKVLDSYLCVNGVFLSGE